MCTGKCIESILCNRYAIQIDSSTVAIANRIFKKTTTTTKHAHINFTVALCSASHGYSVFNIGYHSTLALLLYALDKIISYGDERIETKNDRQTFSSTKRLCTRGDIGMESIPASWMRFQFIRCCSTTIQFK